MTARDTFDSHVGFTPDTHVWTDFGMLEICHLKPGMRLLSRHEDTGDLAYVNVVVISTHSHVATYDLFYVDAEGDVDLPVTTTLGQPFMVDGRGWVRAGALREGDRLLTKSGSVTLWDFADANQRTTLYDIATNGFHNYCVGGSGLWTNAGGRIESP